ncbi:MAG: cupin domain-containing protein [Thermoleophilaceae bacterium]|nr:cupin domain-containing protein [Thermoleophilaceae bacterium]
MSHPKTGERVTFVRTSDETGGRFCELELIALPGTRPAAAHIHPEQLERFTIHSGRVRVRLGRGESDHGAGETVVVEPGTPHTWTAVGHEELHLTARIEPALNAERFFEDFFALAEAGKTNRAGVPTPLHLAVLLADNPGFLYLEKPPLRVQKAMVRALAPLGRALGYGRRQDGEGGIRTHEAV